MQYAKAKIEERWPGTVALCFGHVADSNLHLSVRSNGDPKWEHQVEELVYATVGEWKGSISAEHGIGTEKKKYLGYSRSETELGVMRALKQALDPKGILNPGKVLA
jgi:FAD/FMN-containing dehydrogenase